MLHFFLNPSSQNCRPFAAEPRAARAVEEGADEPRPNPHHSVGHQPHPVSGVAIWSKSRFVVDFRNLLFGRDFDLSFSKGYSLMKFFNL